MLSLSKQATPNHDHRSTSSTSPSGLNSDSQKARVINSDITRESRLFSCKKLKLQDN
uniref:Uncharacterized protein n=1 Tax=Kalanchoe fedtschenkoi TaxID=63787 RepID=A0A7N0VJ30_KALFE